MMGDGIQGGFDGGAALDLDDRQDAASLGQDVDLALRRLQAEREDALAGGHQEEGRSEL
jgi:hypothetical protein